MTARPCVAVNLCAALCVALQTFVTLPSGVRPYLPTLPSHSGAEIPPVSPAQDAGGQCDVLSPTGMLAQGLGWKPLRGLTPRESILYPCDL